MCKAELHIFNNQLKKSLNSSLIRPFVPKKSVIFPFSLHNNKTPQRGEILHAAFVS